ncbi:Reverse transcriptase domain-containing protein, partial [Aphis craccivora]
VDRICPLGIFKLLIYNDECGLNYCLSAGPRVQCVPDIFAFNNFYQLNGISNHIGGSLNLVFSNNCSVLVEKSEVFSVPVHAIRTDCSFLMSFNWFETIVSLDATNALYDALNFCLLNFVPEVMSRCPKDYNEFSNLWGRYKYEYKSCYKSFLAQTECKLKTNPRSFWDFVQKNKSSDGISYTVGFGTEPISNLFSSYFSTVYATNCFFTTNDVELGLSILKTSKSAGTDGLPGTYITQNPISVFSCDYFSHTCIKSIDKTDVHNYRLISIQNYTAKLFEQLVLKCIQPSVNSILVDKEYGFRPSRSATTNLIVFHNFILEAIEKRTQVDVICTDYPKHLILFDHKILIEVLYKAGFGVQWVKILGCKYETVVVPSGVPQGGHLSPLLFSLLVNGLKLVIPDSLFFMFADDFKIFRVIEAVTDCVTLQKELDVLVLWFNSL